MRKSLIALLLCAGVMCAQKKEIVSELEKIRNSFFTQSIWTTVSVTGYKHMSDTKGFNIGNGELIIKPNEGYYSNFDNQICISNKSHSVYIDDDERMITVSEKSVSKGKNGKLPDIDQILETGDSLQLSKQIESGINRITVLSGSAGISKTEIYYNAKNGLIDRVVYYYTNSEENNFGLEKVLIKYTYKDAASITEMCFDSKKYVKRNISGKYEAQEVYRKYKLIQNR